MGVSVGVSYEAAVAAREYAPTKAPETKGKWGLPAGGIFNQIQLYKKEIDSGLTLIEGKAWSGMYYWTSNVYSAEDAWYWYSGGAFNHVMKY